MTAPDAVERIRMCVAEAGYDPALIRPAPHPWAAYARHPSIPREVAWRAREVAGVRTPLCCECHGVGVRRQQGMADICRAVRRLELDCGADR